MPHIAHRGFCCLVLSIALSGCAAARYVMKDGDSGVVAIPMNSNSWPSHHRERAEKLMSEHFPAGYYIEREEEAVVGQNTTFKEDSDGGTVKLGKFEIGKGNRSGTETTTNQTEWRIYYRRQ